MVQAEDVLPDPCLECTFRCKRDFAIYVWNRKLGLFKMPMDKMHTPVPQDSDSRSGADLPAGSMQK